VEIEAESIGHDLALGRSRFTRSATGEPEEATTPPDGIPAPSP
jgi:hypothetical protein